MNIDIVNKQVGERLKIPEKKVALVNKFYWRQVYDHLYAYDDRPLNIDHICVLYNDKWLIKKYIKYYIKKIRRTIESQKFKYNSPLRGEYIGAYKLVIKELWRLRKLHKFTN